MVTSQHLRNAGRFYSLAATRRKSQVFKENPLQLHQADGGRPEAMHDVACNESWVKYMMHSCSLKMMIHRRKGSDVKPKVSS
jgi:hypothetical protein